MRKGTKQNKRNLERWLGYHMFHSKQVGFEVHINPSCTINQCTAVRYLPEPQSWFEVGLKLEESLRQMIIQGVAETALVESTELREKEQKKKD